MSNASNKFYEFSAFRIDAQEKLLLRAGERIPLTPKAFDTLLILVERHGHIVEKNELMQMVWPDATVEENNLNQNISTIRKALGENSSTQQFIETLPRRGYRFIAEVKEVVPPGPEPLLTSVSPVKQNVAAPPPTAPPRPLARLGFWLGLLLVALLGLVYFLVAKRDTAARITGTATIKINRLPNTSGAWELAISPDGKLVAFIVGDVSKQSLRVKQIDTAADTVLLEHEAGRFRGLTFAPDGKSLYYSQREPNASAHVLYRKPIQGGEAKRLLAGVDSAVTFSPDGNRLAFVRESSKPGESSLVAANIDGGEERVLATYKSPQYFAVEGPAWSPDGTIIAVAARRSTTQFRFQIVTINVNTGQETIVPTQNWGWAAKVTWLPDMRGLVLVGRGEQDNSLNDQLWMIDYPGGQSHKLLPTLNTYRGIGIDKTGNSLVTVRSEMRANLWVLPDTNSKLARMITSDSASQLGGNGVAWTPDGRLVYTSVASGHKDLWIMQADGTQAKPLTTDPQDNVESPSVTADGQAVVFNAGRSGIPRIWRIGLDGKSPLELSHGKLDLQSASSPVENFVYFSQEIAGQRTVSRVSTAGGAPQALTDKLTEYPSVSPDGKWVACLYQETPSAPQQVAILPAAGGAPTHLIDLPSLSPTSLRWHPDGQSLTFLMRQDGAVNIWRKPITGGAPEKITNFETERIFAYAWSRHGRTLACARGVVHREIVMLNDFSK